MQRGKREREHTLRGKRERETEKAQRGNEDERDNTRRELELEFKFEFCIVHKEANFDLWNQSIHVVSPS